MLRENIIHSVFLLNKNYLSDLSTTILNVFIASIVSNVFKYVLGVL